MTTAAPARRADDWKSLEDIVSKDIFKAEIAFWAKRIGVEPKQVHVRPMTRKWGSCTTAGRVSFNEELLRESADFRKEVIVHELLHLKLPNHGKLFRALLKAHLGRSDLVLPPYPAWKRRSRNEPGARSQRS